MKHEFRSILDSLAQKQASKLPEIRDEFVFVAQHDYIKKPFQHPCPAEDGKMAYHIEGYAPGILEDGAVNGYFVRLEEWAVREWKEEEKAAYLAHRVGESRKSEQVRVEIQKALKERRKLRKEFCK